MSIIKIGDEYVNLDQVTSISVRYPHDVCVRVGDFHYYITAYNLNEISNVLSNMSKSTIEKWAEKQLDNSDLYRMNLLAHAIIELNEKAGHVIDPDLEERIRIAFKHIFDEKEEEK